MNPTDISFECGICKSQKIQEQLVVKEMCRGTRHQFNYVLCGDCGTLQLTNPPLDYEYYYEGYYSLTPGGLKINVANRIKWKLLLLTFPWLGDFLFGRGYKKTLLEVRGLRDLPRKVDWKILDVGAGQGNLLDFLSQVGFSDCVGCDPFIEKDIVYRSRVRILKKRIDEIDGSFDLVMLNHALEHVPDPYNVIHQVARLMKVSGYCILRFPNINSIEFLRYKANWWGIHAPYHTFIYSREAVDLLAVKNGLKIVNAYCDSRFDHYIYSEEYSLDIDDKSPLSHRNGGGLLCSSERKLLTEKALDYDTKGIGDWIVYILRHIEAT